jgi:hypothetical protein
MDSKITHSRKATINIMDEKEFKLWLKFIISVDKNGGDISKPADILWRSFQGKIKTAGRRCRI